MSSRRLDERARAADKRRMEIRRLTPAYAVSPQIAPEDLPRIAEAGYRTVICNRPDPEVPPELQAASIRAAAEAAGLAFLVNPVTHGGMTPAMVAAQANAIAAGPALAYCASGTRST